MRRHYRTLELDLTNGLNGLEVPLDGSVCFYHRGVSPLEIALNSNGNDKIPLYPKEKIEAPFNALYISSYARPETATLLISKPVGQQLTGGEVRVVTDTGFFNTMGGRTWIGGLYRTGAAGRHFAGLTNRSEDYIGIVERLLIFSTSGGANADFVYCLFEENVNSVAYPFLNKNIWHGFAAAMSACGPTRTTIAGPPAWPPGATQNSRILLDINGTADYVPNLNHFIVEPGYTFYIGSSGSINQMLRVVVEWREEPIRE